MDDIPNAKDQVPPPEKPLTPEEDQRKSCIDAVKKINESNPSVTMTFYIPLQEDLKKQIEEKGYTVSYNLSYTSNNKKTPYICEVTISNPNLASKQKEKKSKATTDAFVKLMASISDKNKPPPSNQDYIDLASMFFSQI